MAQLQSNLPPQPPLLRVEPFKGLNLSVTPTQIDQSQSPDMMNFNVDERGALNKRTGYMRVFNTSLGTGKINGMHEYRKKNGTVLFLLAHGTKLYKQSASSQPVEIYNGLSNLRVRFFTFNDKCYIMDGANYLWFDGTTVSAVTPYIPTLSISKIPGTNPGGKINEPFNLLGAGFKDTFTGDNTGKDFYLSLKNLDTTPVIVKVGGVTKTLTTDYTVDLVNGKVSFVTAPPVGTNNVEITAYKTISGNADKIKKCNFFVVYGGSNDTRVFFGGNADSPNQIWKSNLTDLNEVNYFPDNGNYVFPERVKGFSKQYDYMLVHRNNGYHQITFELSDTGASFPSKPINDQVGTIATESIQIIENNPVSLSKNGVYMVVQSNIRDERNVQHISTNIDTLLLNESGLENAISVDYDRKYWIAINNKVFVYDYAIGEWYLYDNIPASCFLEMNGDLYFGGEGLVYRFKKETETLPYNDDGSPIEAYWKSKHMTFGLDERKKLVEKVFFGMKPAAKTSANLSYISDKKISDIVKSKRMDTFDFNNFDFNNFTFILSSFPQEVMAKIKAKKITQFQLILENKELDESLGILSIGIKWRPQAEVK